MKVKLRVEKRAVYASTALIIIVGLASLVWGGTLTLTDEAVVYDGVSINMSNNKAIWIKNSSGTYGAMLYVDPSDRLQIGYGLSSGVSTIKKIVMKEPMDMSNYPISNIGDSGTDFDSSGGLTLADNLTLNPGQTGYIYSDDIIFKNDTGDIYFRLTQTGSIQRIDAYNNPIVNIGDSGTDLDSNGGLTLAGNLTVTDHILFGSGDADDYITIDGNDDILFYKDGSCVFNATAAGACS